MANEMPEDTSERRRMTTDREEIREWAESRDAVPVSTRGGEAAGPTFARSDELTEDHEEHTWDEFFETFEEDDWVFVYHEEAPADDDLGFFEMVERDRAFDRTDLGREEFEDALRQGETVTSEIVETRVVEREVVERDTIESEIVDAEVAERDVVDSELLEREVVEVEFVDDDLIEVLVDETRMETIEVIEHLTVESRVVDVDVDVEREREHDEVETEIGIESVQRSIFESDVVRADVSADDALEREMIRSHRTEGDVVRSELVERRTVEEEIRERLRMRFTLEETELIDSEVIASDAIEGELIDVEEFAPGEMAAGADAETGEAGADATASPDPGVAVEAQGEAGAAGDDPEQGGTAPVELSERDQGKTVVDASGQQIGIVSSVEAETMYVDPEPGLTDRLKARLNWGGHDDDEYPVEPAQIREITDDEVVLRGE